MSSRRTFLKRTGAALAALNLAEAVESSAAPPRPAASRHWAAASRPAGAAKGLSAYSFGGNVWVRMDDRPLTCYRADPTQKYPYFYPVCGPASGASLTEEAGGLYPHHRSLYLACDQVNGGNYWQEGVERGQILSRGPQLKEQTKERVVIADVCDWRQPGKPAIIVDRRTWTITAPEPGQRIIDADITLTAETDIEIRQTNHALFSVRAAHDLAPAGGGAMLNANGRKNEPETFGQEAAWCGFQARRGGEDGPVEAIVLMDHPRNPWSPCKWFTRDYGFMSPMPFNWLERWSLPAGKAVHLRYRVLAMAGPIEAPAVKQRYEEFAR